MEIPAVFVTELKQIADTKNLVEFEIYMQKQGFSPVDVGALGLSAQVEPSAVKDYLLNCEALYRQQQGPSDDRPTDGGGSGVSTPPRPIISPPTFPNIPPPVAYATREKEPETVDVVAGRDRDLIRR